MPHIPGHPAEEEENNEETGGLSYLMPDTVEEDSKLKSPEQIAEGGGFQVQVVQVEIQHFQ